MNVNAVSFQGNPQAQKPKMSKGKKAAIIAGSVAGAAAVASVVAAGFLGKGKVEDVQGLKKLFKTLGEGYKEMGDKAVRLFKKAMNKIMPDNGNIIEFTPVEDLGEVVEEVTEKL